MGPLDRAVRRLAEPITAAAVGRVINRLDSPANRARASDLAARAQHGARRWASSRQRPS